MGSSGPYLLKLQPAYSLHIHILAIMDDTCVSECAYLVWMFLPILRAQYHKPALMFLVGGLVDVPD